MKNKLIITAGLVLAGLQAMAQQEYPHYTMFMYNKLIYNPAYAGSKDVTSFNAAYRSQWVGINGAPQTLNFNVHGPVGSYKRAFRPVALGLTVSNESAGVVNNTDIAGIYAYRLKFDKTKTILSLGVKAGMSVYSARLSDLNPKDGNDQKLNNGDIRNSVLPNFGVAAFWYNDKFYVGASVPNLLENYYDKDFKNTGNGVSAKQIRTYYITGGYVFTINENFRLSPQVLGRYAADSRYALPFNADINLSAIFYDRLMIGATFRTDKSINGIVHVQATKNINIGYSYDYAVSGLNGYNKGSHEVVVGFDLFRDKLKYVNPRFIKFF
jgi:type IX secretion system PorP/SprF family membrane protein